jgi:hypothetical protein
LVFRRRALIALAAGSVVAAAAACNLLTGASALDVDDGTGDGANEPRAREDATRVDAPVAAPPVCDCVSPPPPGWTGPFALLESTGAGRACPTGLASVFDGGADPNSTAPCTPCTCGAPIGTCATSVTIYGNLTGGGATCTTTCRATQPIDTTCAAVNYCSPGQGAIVTVDGGCAADGGRVSPASWGRGTTACTFAAAAPATCPTGQACAPKSEAAPDARICILHAGDVECPAGPYAAPVKSFARIVDTRSCTACECDAGGGGGCGTGTVTLYAGAGCTTALKDVPTSGACTGFTVSSGPGSMKLTVSPTPDGGTCTPLGGALADGGLIAAEPTTLCCL